MKRKVAKGYDVKRKRIINIEKMKGDAIVIYSLPEKPGIWFYPLIVDGKNVEPYELLETDAID
ncbi:MAG: hypothetical protein JRI72_00265 [Deltaproteobacteria bacterium]|nr:hypothetical protein [Deltaproteobacteria bacterium]